MTAFDTTNLRLAVTVPAHGKVRFKIRCQVTGATTSPTVLLGVLNGATVVGRVAPQYENATANATSQNFVLDAEFTASGLTPGAANFDAAYAVQVVVASTNIKYGGPNTNGGANAWGAFLFEAWDPQPLKLALDGGVNMTQILGTAVSAPATAGILDVNIKNMNNVSASPITTIKAVQGLTTADTIATYTGNTPQTGDAYARIGAAGAGLTALGDTRIANLDAAVTTRMATYTQPSGFLAATFPTGTIANTTNITAGTITTATNLTTNNDKTGYALSTAGILAIWHQLTSAIVTASTIGKLIVDNLNATVSSRSIAGDAMTLTSGERTSIGTAVWASTTRTLSSFGTLVADIWASATRTLSGFAFTVDTNTNATETAIKAKTDQFVFTVANQVDANALAVPATADDAVLAAIAALNNLSQANIRTAVGLATANLDTQLDALPTNSELTAALASADDATLAAVAALNNLSSAQVQTAAAAALAAYDPPTRTEATADKDEVLTAVGDVPTNAELTTALGTADDAVLAQVALVKAKTDLLSFTDGNIDANVKAINDTGVTGTGETGSEWGPV
jgi:hypothetical protein